MSIFVFGSNLAGVHGAGAAKEAHQNHGAEWGVGEGRTGNAYAIPTKNRLIQSLTLFCIVGHVRRFCSYAGQHPDENFFVTRIGCGLAGFRDAEIGPLFRHAPANCVLPIEWRLYHSGKVTTFHSWDDEQKKVTIV